MQRAGRTVLDIPLLEVSRGETLAILGPNGAGKSTLLLTLALLLSPTKGRLWFDGLLIDRRVDWVALRRRMAVVFQEPLLLDLSVYENVTLGLQLRGVPVSERARRAWYWLEQFGIADLARRPARDLSGGEAQRTSLARAFALSPEILFLDEPFAGLDAPTRAEVIEHVAAVIRDAGITTVLVTHERDEALALGNRVGVLIDGRLVQLDRPEIVFSAPTSPEVAAFVGVETVVSGYVVAYQDGVASVRVGPHIVEAVAAVHPGRAVWVCLRPEDVTLWSEDAVGESSARNRLIGHVVHLRPVGSQVRVTVDCGFPVVALITRHSAQALSLNLGQRVMIAFKASAVHLVGR
ncbi:MAG: ABC transporter ATP-binding protein [Anaerolineae bacterium]|nr:ABC transporter ATP-binding protein [Anaerolineae bacterium]